MWNDTDIPLAHLITFRCYGTWLHGDERGSVDRAHNRYRSDYIPVNDHGCWNEQHSPWVKKGSKRNLWNEHSIARAIDYVINGQGHELPDFD